MASLGRDLAHIRKEQELSLEDIYETTKIPVRILKSIEDDSIFTDFEDNATYIRSYVRSYAKALSIDEKQIVYALNKVEKDDYSGSLQSLFEEPPERPFEDDKKDESDIEESDADEKSAKPDEYQDEEMVHDHSPEFESEATDLSEEPPQTPKTSPLPKADHPDIKSVDWANMGRKFQPLKTVRPKMWAGIFVTILIIIGAVSFFYLYDSEPVSDEAANNTTTTRQEEPFEQGVSTDSLELDIVPSSETDDTARQQSAATADNFPNETLSALPDTLNMVVYAAYGRLEPVRVYTDIMDDINPYWIEQGEAIRFNFVNELNIRGQFSRMVLLLNGHPVQNIREEFYNPDTRRLEINRTYFEDDPQWLQPAPDSLEIDAPPPSTIKDRPTFN